MSEEISDEELAAFLAAHGDIHIPAVGGHGWVTSEAEALWARLHDTEQRLTDAESRVSWLFTLVVSLAVALGLTDLSWAIQSISSR